MWLRVYLWLVRALRRAQQQHTHMRDWQMDVKCFAPALIILAFNAAMRSHARRALLRLAGASTAASAVISC